jgi:hypothetical protein
VEFYVLGEGHRIPWKEGAAVGGNRFFAAAQNDTRQKGNGRIRSRFFAALRMASFAGLRITEFTGLRMTEQRKAKARRRKQKQRYS